MAPRRDGLDFTLILNHYPLFATCALSIVAWIIAFISQIVLESRISSGPPQVGTLWFGIFLQLAVILAVFYTLASDAIALNRLQLSVFSALGLLYAVQGANDGLHNPLPEGKAMGVGYLLLILVFIAWTLFFTSEEGSITLDVFNSFGTGGLTGPGRRRTVIGGQGIASSRSVPANNGYPSGGYGSPQGVPANIGTYGGIGGGMGGNIGSPAAKEEMGLRSQHSLVSGGGPGSNAGRGIDARSLGGASGQGPVAGTTGGLGGDAATPLMTPAAAPSATDGGETYSYKARALYAYQASPDDPNEISFSKGEILDIMDNSGKWWQARKEDGTTGIAPSNYLQIV